MIRFPCLHTQCLMAVVNDLNCSIIITPLVSNIINKMIIHKVIL